MGDFNFDTLCKNSISKNYENVILTADMKLISLDCPTRETSTTSTCIDYVITTPRLIHSNACVEKCVISDQYGIWLVTGVTTKILRWKKIYRVVEDNENPNIAFNVLFVAKHTLGEIDFNMIDLEMVRNYLRNFYWPWWTGFFC